jgi:LacI family transcriptional regulator
MPSLKEVAQLANVSVTTASRVLNDTGPSSGFSKNCAEKVRQAAQRLGYVRNYHAGSLRVGKAGAIGFAFEFGMGQRRIQDPRQSMLGNDYWSRIIGGVAFGARQGDYQLNLIGPTSRHGGIDLAFRHLHEKRVDGLIVPAQVRKELWGPLLERSHAPVVLVGHRQATIAPVVDYDDQAAVEQVVDHLAELGHRHVLWFGPQFADEADTAARRARAFASAAFQRGMTGSIERFDRDQMYPISASEDIDYAQRGMADVLANSPHRFSAVVCYNDHTALGVYRAAYEAGLTIPGDLSVVGFDDFVAEHAWPPMTTASHQCVTMGRRAVELLVRMIDQPETRRQLAGHYEQVTPQLVVRQSTAPPSQSQPHSDRP